MAYNTYGRPQLEYCSNSLPGTVRPWQKTFSQKIENVQRSAARYVCNNYNYTSSVTCMLKSLNWHTLEYRRNNSSLMYFYKIRNALVHVDHHHLISTRNLNYLIPHSKGPATRNDFVNDIVNDARADAIFATLKAIVDDETSTISSTKSLRVAGP